jgi:hypothetical protein
MQEFWIDSVTGAILARELAIHLRRTNPDDDFVSGLLRDLGELLLWQAFPERWDEHVTRHGLRLIADPCAAERDTFGIDHADISAELLQRWKIPPEIVEPIRHHHQPERLAGSVPSWHARAELLAFAAQLAQLDKVVQDPALLDGLLATAQNRYNLSQPELVTFLQQIVPKVDEFAQLVNQDIGQCPDYAAILAAGNAELVNLAMTQNQDQPSDQLDLATTIRLSGIRSPAKPTSAQPMQATQSTADTQLPRFRKEFLTHFPRSGCLLGEYALRRQIGSGAMGLVFQAFEARLQRDVAVKLLAPQLAAISMARRRFVREARLAAAIQHENVVAIYAIGEADGIPYLAMEYVRVAVWKARSNSVVRSP